MAACAVWLNNVSYFVSYVDNVRSCRPISNLSVHVLSSLLERLVTRQLMQYPTFRHCSRHFGRVIRLTLQSYECCQTFHIVVLSSYRLTDIAVLVDFSARCV